MSRLGNKILAFLKNNAGDGFSCRDITERLVADDPAFFSDKFEIYGRDGAERSPFRQIKAEVQARLIEMRAIREDIHFDGDNRPHLYSFVPVPATSQTLAASDEENVAGETVEEREATEHTRMQYTLARIGHAFGYQVWIAANDRHRTVDGVRLGDLPGVVNDLPDFAFDPRTRQTVRNIDVIWLRRRTYVATFEVECTTSIYSGLLRMSDLCVMVPNLHLQTFIVAPRRRRDAVVNEIMRPTFSEGMERPLHEVCRYLSTEMLNRIAGFDDMTLASLRKTALWDNAERIGPEEDAVGDLRPALRLVG